MNFENPPRIFSAVRFLSRFLKRTEIQGDICQHQIDIPRLEATYEGIAIEGRISKVFEYLYFVLSILAVMHFDISLGIFPGSQGYFTKEVAG